MAIYHLSAKPVQRSNGESAVAGAAYRAGEKLHDARRDKTEDYRRKRGVVVAKIIAPENAPEWVYDREQLWNRAELMEKRWDAQPAREIRLALPHELDAEQRADLVFSFARDAFVKNGMVADIGIHLPDRHGDERNHHAHILLTMRELDGDGFSRKKQREWNKSELLEGWREQWEIYQNRALEEAGSDARVDHRTLEAQGIDREPTKHLGKDATALERRGEKSELGDINREITEEHEPDDIEATEHERYIADLVNELAAAEAEYAAELEKEFAISEEEALSAEELENPYFTEAPEPEESIFDNPVSREFERQLREKGRIREVRPAYEEELFEDFDPEPEELPDYYPSHPRFTHPQPEESIFDSPLNKWFEQQLREYGSIREYGLGKHWYDRTVAYWQDLYNDAATFVKDTWQKYVSDRKDRDKSPGGESGLLDDTVDRVKGFWQKYVKGRDDDPDRDDFEPER